MKIVLIIYLTITVICILLILLGSACANAKYKRMYPNLGLPKRTFIEYLTRRVRTVIFSCIPIFNILWLFAFIFKWDDIINESVKRIKEEKEKES